MTLAASLEAVQVIAASSLLNFAITIDTNSLPRDDIKFWVGIAVSGNVRFPSHD